jgi:3''-phosphoadenosine 5''-phosphosulfate sulfotransferase (PAPS reductase)/FAD synthetase and related enzymes
MSKITWDKETGGVKLSSFITKETLGVPPRPVFYEELDLLKLNDLGWQYPKSQDPLLWACNKQYFYCGNFVFEVKGANIYNAPTVVFQQGFERMSLIPMNIKAMLENCKDEMFLIESEAIEFIRGTYVQYSSALKIVQQIQANQLDYEVLATKIEKQTKQKMAIVKQDCDSFDIIPLDNAKKEGKKTYQTTRIDKFLASFSGGKDSQVVLDLCVRAIPPSAFEVIYSDTGYELPTSLSLYEDVKAFYGKKIPKLKFSIARNHESVINYWDKIGTPSDTHRWCCSVMKTAPLYRMLKVENTNRQARVLTFDGVRAEESNRRSEYVRIGKGVKHDTVINARPILDWNTTEVYLYLFRHNLPMNEAYRQGRARVGCIICPYSSSWDDMISNSLYKKELSPFLSRIVDSAKKGGIKDVDNYVKDRKWKFRSSGNFVESDSSISINGVIPNLKANIQGAKQKIETWLPTLGDYTISYSEKAIKGEILFNKTIFPFLIEFGKKDNDFKCTLFNTNDAQLIKFFKRVLYKTTYCINCEACEVECPTGALTVFPEVKIDRYKCIHCHKCLDFHDSGCIVANSLILTTETNMKAKSGIDRYNTFGLKEEWIDMFFSDTIGYWENNGLGTKQVPAMKNWLRDAEIIDGKNNLTELGKLLSEIYQDRQRLVWEIIWINLTYNSFISQWFSARIKINTVFTKLLLNEMLQNEFPNVYSDRTVKNSLDALIRTFKESPIGNSFNMCVSQDKDSLIRLSYEDLSEEAIAYSIYKYAEAHNTKMLRVSEFYKTDTESGVYIEFGIGKPDLEKALRTLNSLMNRVLVAELNMGLDHITLRDDLTSFKVLQELT